MEVGSLPFFLLLGVWMFLAVYGIVYLVDKGKKKIPLDRVASIGFLIAFFVAVVIILFLKLIQHKLPLLPPGLGFLILFFLFMLPAIAFLVVFFVMSFIFSRKTKSVRRSTLFVIIILSFFVTGVAAFAVLKIIIFPTMAAEKSRLKKLRAKAHTSRKPRKVRREVR